MKQFFLILAFFIACKTAISQTQLPRFGEISNEDLALTQCAFDKTADAVVLFDQAISNYNDDWNLITERRIKFKILKESGIGRSNINIRFYSGDDFE